MESYEGQSKSSMVDNIGNERGRKSFMPDSAENEEGSASFMADRPEKKSCTICLSSGTCIYHSAEPNQQFSVYSSVCEDVGKENQHLHIEGHQMGATSKPLDVEEDATPEQSFFGSSVCYGGPEEYYANFNGRKKETDRIQNEVRKLEEAADPSNLEYTIRGNWWKGSLDY
ncbi:hypothetical protein SUGI_0371450 [Cryptomeria japonica]|uniref:uncharacterized protein LOC131061189 n=1 Tax=Cryptomeria japonica TaxID=3369 RepID=UPI002408A6C5|nr:uncharacterized protein LOC131061189 [Cryptomeria japonica]GLJ20439.1 hypothetical protein SUGI_0371450 [Cryptomeria japonica]